MNLSQRDRPRRPGLIRASATNNAGIEKVEFYVGGTKIGGTTETECPSSRNATGLATGSAHAAPGR
jgi:hypothetical protein